MWINRAVMCVAWMSAVSSLHAQSVLIAPTAIVIDAARPSAAITLVNTGTAPAEVALSFAFGLPATDSVGNMYLKLDENPADTLPSAVDFLHAYPSRLVLPAGGRQVVRLVAAPQRSLAAREYWARLVVTSRQGRPLLASPSSTTGIVTEAQVALDLEVRSVLAVFYRPAGLSTALKIGVPSVRIANGQIESRARLSRVGNAAFVGSIAAVLRDRQGTIQSRLNLPLGVYNDIEPLIALPLGTLPRGTYELELSAHAERPDVPSTSLLPVQAVSRKVAVTVP
ncbi:hypothetical protein [Gemmatimonas aurantiaca]|uniref:fimbrial biogenesis chaperone n=1 Tax=Gemmatimonas aurantiaca TaxID=173480 RepID=UPI00301B72B2